MNCRTSTECLIICFMLSSLLLIGCGAPATTASPPTATFVSTNTPAPTGTLAPTDTPAPSITPSPTATFTPTASPTPVQIHLQADGGGDYATLEEAIKGAAEGATIYLAPGVYNLEKGLVIAKSLHLIGQGIEETEIVSGAEKYVLHISVKGTFSAEGITYRHEGIEAASVVIVERGGNGIHRLPFHWGCRQG